MQFGNLTILLALVYLASIMLGSKTLTRPLSGVLFFVVGFHLLYDVGNYIEVAPLLSIFGHYRQILTIVVEIILMGLTLVVALNLPEHYPRNKREAPPSA